MERRNRPPIAWKFLLQARGRWCPLLEYYPWPWLGMGTGLGYTSRGPGKINPDLDQSLGNPDSTYREHYYFRTMDVPFYVALRSPSFNQNRCRLSTRIGGGFSRNFKSTYMFHSVEDGFHDYKDMKDDFYKTDFLPMFLPVWI